MKMRDILNESSGKNVPEKINVQWNAPKLSTNVKSQKTYSFKDLKGDSSTMTKRILSAANASKKYKIGYIVHLNGNAHPVEKYVLLHGTYYYVFSDDDNVHISKFTI